MANAPIPQPFIWRRLQSLMGLWLVIFLTQHLLVNSQAALFIGDDGKGFIHAANALEGLPYLPVLEFIILAIPILIHTIWGIKYIFTAKYNSYGDNGHTPYLPDYKRNKAYAWQRWSAWILAIGIIAHVIQMRFIERPISTEIGSQEYYLVKVEADSGLYTLSQRLNVQLFDQQLIQQTEQSLAHQQVSKDLSPAAELIETQNIHQRKEGLEALKRRPLNHEAEMIAVANNFGTADLLMVRETFKNPLMIVLYTLFVIAACYHAFNGLWTFMISWGIIQSQNSQRLMLKICHVLMVVVGLLGLTAIWLTYWINLKT
jgi:succinate dehydrogenase / fumarate reductase cytochrome b subunit